MADRIIKDSNEIVAELRRRRPFDRMGEEDVRWMVDRMEVVELAKGAAVLTAGKPCDRLYFIHSGGIQIEAMGDASDESKVLAELGEGESFPVEALYERRPVFSTFRTKSDTVCYRLSLADFDELMARNSIFAEFCKYRSESFLEQSRRVYRLHFLNQSDDQQRLNTSISILMCPDPLTAEGSEPVRAVVSEMYRRDTDAAVIVDEMKNLKGIFTMRDLISKVVVSGADIECPVEQVMTADPRTIAATALGYEAALAMAEKGVHHLVVVDGGKLAGIVTEHDLFNLQKVSLGQLSFEIQSADSAEQLKQCHKDILLLAENMLIQGVSADQITQIISSLNDQVISRVLAMELAKEDFRGIRISWIALGSEGRMEQTFATDQDNGIIFSAPGDMSDDDARAVLLPAARRINEILDGIGYPLCKGNIMASNPACCLSLKEWQEKFTNWIELPTPEALLNADIFLDFRHVYGEEELSNELRSWLCSTVKSQSRFFHLLAENALERKPPLGFFRDFVVDAGTEHPGTIDIKLNGVTLFVDAARIYALAAGICKSNTRDRILAAGDAFDWPQSDVNAWAGAFSFLQTLRVRSQFECMREGGVSHNRINPYDLNNLDKKFFIEALRQAGKLQGRLGSNFTMNGRSATV